MTKASLLIVIASYLLPACRAEAVLPLPVESEGIVQAVDRESRTFTVAFNDKPRVQQLVWNKDTAFVDGVRFTTSATLNPGGIVHVRYQLPIFGKPFATRVAVQQPQQPRR